MRYIWFLAVLMFLVSCKDETDTTEEKRKQSAIDEQLILDYLEENNLTATRYDIDYGDVNYGLYYTTLREGSGARPNAYSTVRVKYSGYLLDGTMFDTSGDEVIAFSLQSVVAGWTYGIPLIRPGGRAILYIPSGLGYGTTSSGSIPANSVLKFDVTLIEYQ